MGLATASNKGSHYNEYLKIQAKAKEGKVGIWGTDFND
jgi:endonuclease YncB( thermonuclease family)